MNEKLLRDRTLHQSKFSLHFVLPGFKKENLRSPAPEPSSEPAVDVYVVEPTRSAQHLPFRPSGGPLDRIRGSESGLPEAHNDQACIFPDRTVSSDTD